jgi:AcrR family transcriptional regulator
MTTHEKIWREALNLFSMKGFDAVSVRDIAGAVGIKESSLYNHYKNKRDIFDTIVKECTRRTDEQFRAAAVLKNDMQWTADERTVNMYRNMTPEQFAAMALGVFDFVFTDELSVKLRRMLTIEQFRSEDLASTFRQVSFDDALTYQAALFDAMMRAGAFVKADPYMVAMAFYAPIFLLFYKFDNSSVGLREARELFERHLKHFISTYAVSGREES